MERSFTDEAGTKRQEKQTLEIRSQGGKLTGGDHPGWKFERKDRIGAMTATKIQAPPATPAPQ